MDEPKTSSEVTVEETPDKEMPKKDSLPRRVVRWLSTALLIACTLLCFVVVLRTALRQDNSILGYRLFYVVSGSMEPNLPINSLLLVKPDDSYEVNEIITFYSKDPSIAGHPNTHRIIAKKTENGVNYYTTQGDANLVPDLDIITDGDIIGRVRLHVAAGGVIGTVMGILSTPAGFFAVVLIPLLIVAVICMKDFKKALEEEMRRKALASLEQELLAEKEATPVEADRESEETAQSDL